MTKLSELPFSVLVEITDRMHRGGTDRAIAAWLVMLPNRNGCANLAEETFRTYLAPFRDEVRKLDRYRVRSIRLLHRAQMKLERESETTAVSVKLHRVYATAAAAPTPAPLTGAPSAAGPAAPAAPAEGDPTDPSGPSSSGCHGNESSASTGCGTVSRESEIPPAAPRMPDLKADSLGQWFLSRLNYIMAQQDQREIGKLVILTDGHRIARMLNLESMMPVLLDQTRKELETFMKFQEMNLNMEEKLIRNAKANAELQEASRFSLDTLASEPKKKDLDTPESRTKEKNSERVERILADMNPGAYNNILTFGILVNKLLKLEREPPDEDNGTPQS